MTAPTNQEFISGTTITSQWLNGVNDHVNNIDPIAHSSDTISFIQSGTDTVQRTTQNKMREAKSILDFIPPSEHAGIANSTSAYLVDAAFSAAFSAGIKNLTVPPGRYVADNSIYVPDNTHVYLEEGAVIYAVGRDTHGRNSALFTKCNGTGFTTALVILIGSNCSLTGPGVVHGNGLNNWYDNGGIKVYQDGSDIDSSFRLGFACVRVGMDAFSASTAARPYQRNVDVSRITVRYGSWGGIQLFGETQRLVVGETYPFEDRIGVDGAKVVGCTLEFCNSNVLPVIGCKNFLIVGNHLISPAHSGIKLYRHWANGVVAFNRITWDDSHVVSWLDTKTVDYYRESQFQTRSECISIGHNTNTGVARDVAVFGNMIDGQNKLYRGIACYSPANNVTVSGNEVKGVVRPFLFGPIGTFKVSGNSFIGQNYTYTAVNPGTQLVGESVALSVDENTINGTYTETRLSFSGNSFGGQVLNLVRMNSWEGWNTLGIKATVTFEGNQFNLTDLQDWDSLTKIAVASSSAPAAGSSIVFRGNTYINGSAYVDDFDTVFETAGLASIITDLIWKRNLTLGVGIVAGPDGTPRLVYDDVTGKVTLIGSIGVGYAVGTAVAVATIPTRFRTLNNCNFIVDNNSATGTQRSACVRITQSGNLFISAADSTRFVSLHGLTWETRY